MKRLDELGCLLACEHKIMVMLTISSGTNCCTLIVCQVPAEEVVEVKYEYLVVNQDLRNSPVGATDLDQISGLLNVHGARGWHLDRFWDSDDGSCRFFLLRKESPRLLAESKSLSF